MKEWESDIRKANIDNRYMQKTEIRDTHVTYIYVQYTLYASKCAISLVYALNKRSNLETPHKWISVAETKGIWIFLFYRATNHAVLILNNSRHEGKSHPWRSLSVQAAVVWRRCWRLPLSCSVAHKRKRMHDVRILLKILEAFRQYLAFRTGFAIQPAAVLAGTRNV